MTKKTKKTTICSRCDMRYEGYVIIMCKDIECFVLWKMFRDRFYYSKDHGLCKPCREFLIRDPVERRYWYDLLHFELDMVYKGALEDKGKDVTFIKKAIARVTTELERLNKHPDVILNREEVRKKLEANTLVGKDGMCVYCGEFPGNVRVLNPNDWGEEAKGAPKAKGYWMVCVTCKKVIRAQQKQSMGLHVLRNTDDPELKTILKAGVQKAQAEIDALSYESGMPSLSVSISIDEEGKIQKDTREEGESDD